MRTKTWSTLGILGLTALVACPIKDTTPDAFSIAPKTGVAIGTGTVASDPITPEGFDAVTSIRIGGGQYKIGSGSATSSEGELEPGQSVTVIIDKPSKLGESKTATLTIGGVASPFVITAEKIDDFNFLAPTSAPQPGDYESQVVTIKGLSATTKLDVKVSSGNGKYKINNGSCTATASTKSLGLNDKLSACLPIPPSAVAGDVFTTTIEVGSDATGKISKTFSHTLGQTLAKTNPTLTPTSFNGLADVAKSTVFTSNEITVSEINVPVAIGLVLEPTGTTGSLLVNGVVFTGTTINNTDKISVRLTSGATASTSVSGTVNVGTAPNLKTAKFTVRTADPPPPPDTLGANQYASLELPAFTGPDSGIVVADTTPSCKYGTGVGGPWEAIKDASGQQITLPMGGPVFNYDARAITTDDRTALTTAVPALAATAPVVKNGFRKNGVDTWRYYKWSNLPKAQWNWCPDKWDEAKVELGTDTEPSAASGLYTLFPGAARAFGRTALTFNVPTVGTGKIGKVKFKLQIAHESRLDLRVYLIAPGGSTTDLVTPDPKRVLLYDIPARKTLRTTTPDVGYSNGVTNLQTGLVEPSRHSNGISVIFDDAAQPPAGTPANANTVAFRCGSMRAGWEGACADNNNSDGKQNRPSNQTAFGVLEYQSGFGSFGVIKADGTTDGSVIPADPAGLAKLIGLGMAGTWTVVIEDRIPGTRENNDATFIPGRPPFHINATTGNNGSNPAYAVPGDDRELIFQTTERELRPLAQIAVLTVVPQP